MRCWRLERGSAFGAVLWLAACGGEPPRGMEGIELGMTQQEVLDAAREHGGFTCRLRGSRPRLAVCEGPTDRGRLGVVVRDDSVVQVTLRVEAESDGDARRPADRFVRPFGDPAWRDRPLPPRAESPDSYHTLWLDGDSLRALAMVCGGPRLEPPCTAQLTSTPPARVQARLDTLMGIRR